MPDLLRSIAVLSKIILALFFSLRYLNCPCPLHPSFPKEILPHPCHHLPSTRRTGSPFLPSMISYMPPRAYPPLSQEQSAAGLGITAAPRKTAEDEVGKKRTFLEMVGMRWGWGGSPFKTLNRDSSYTFCAERIKTLHSLLSK